MANPVRRFESPDLRLPLLAVLALAPGLLAGAAAGFGVEGLAAGLVSLFVVVAAAAAPRPVTFSAGLASGAIVAAGLLLAHVTGSQPVASGLAMAAVALVAGIAVAGGPVTAIVASILGTAYFLPASLSLTSELSTGETVELGLLGLASGLLMVALLSAFGRFRGKPSEPVAREPRQGVGPWDLMLRSVRHGGPERRYGIRRALLLGTAMGIYQATGDHNVFWVMLTIFAVLLPDMESTWTKALARSSGVVAGALAVGAIAELVPAKVVVTLGVIAMIASLSYMRKNYAVYCAGVSFLVVAVPGEQQGDFLNWAALRAVDTVVGATIALIAVYAILPERERTDPAPT